MVAPEAGDAFRVEVYAYEPFGKYAILTARLGSDTIKAKLFHAIHAVVGDQLSIRFCSTSAVVFDGVTSNAI